jgi:hypothetical protein
MDHSSALVETIARGMIEGFGAAAAPIAREHAQDAALVSDAETWRGVADAIERFLPDPQR